MRKGDLLATVDSHDDAVMLTGRFMQYYRENAKWLERSYDFVPRIGLAELQAIVVDDLDGIAGGSVSGSGLCRLGPIDQIPVGEGRAFAVGDERWPCSGRASAGCTRFRRSARTAAARSPTGSM